MAKQTRIDGKYVTGGAVLAGLLGSSAAHAQVVVTNPNLTVTSPDTLYFDVDDGKSSTSDTTLEFQLDTDESFPFSPKIGPNDATTAAVTGALNAGDTVGSGTTFATSNPKLSNGVTDIGFSLGVPASMTAHYGYIEIGQTSTTAPNLGGGPEIDSFTDTVQKIVYNPIAGQSVTVAPEPGTTSLLLAGAAGAAGLAAWRRRTATASAS